MKFIQKYFYAFAGALLIFGLLFLCFLFSDRSFLQISPETLLEFRLETESGTETIALHPGEDGIVYAFLPSYARCGKLSIHLTSDTPVYLDGNPVMDGMDCSTLDRNITYSLSSPQCEAVPFQLCESANLPTLYINTQSGSMTSIHADKDYEEASFLSVYSAEGICQFTDYQATISGRGNTTWLPDKKPYNLTLSSDTDILGLGSASNWILLANTLDKSNLHNKLVLDFARQADLPWTPNSTFVDLYLNGQYSGLYLLVEKVESHPNRIPLDTQAGDFLCKVEYEVRWTYIRNPFHTMMGRTVEITEPIALSSDSSMYIQAQVNTLEQAISSGEDLNQCSFFDMNSWVRKYLIDEIFMNFDADRANSYFYFQDGVFYSGPLWDYDSILGSLPHISNPQSFYANLQSRPSAYYKALYRNDSFYQQVIQQYQTVFLPLLEQLIDTGVDRYYEELSAAIECNRLRWFSYESPDDGEFSRQISGFLSQRVDFLNRAWVDEVPFCSVQLNPIPGGDPTITAVEYGTVLDLSTFGMEDLEWRSDKTGEVVDLSQPITEDLVLNGNLEAAQTVSTQEILSIGSIAGITVLLVLLMAVDILQRKKERRRSSEKERTKISP